MAYPFCPNLCLRDLIERLRREYGDRVQLISKRLGGPRGDTTVRALTLADGRGPGVLGMAYLPEIDDADALSPDTGRSILVQLGLDPALYGYHLGGEDGEEN